MLEIPYLGAGIDALIEQLKGRRDLWLLQKLDTEMSKLADAPPGPDAAVLQQDGREGHLVWIVSDMGTRMMLVAYAIDRQAGTLTPLDGRLLGSPEVGAAQQAAQELTDALPELLRAS